MPNKTIKKVRGGLVLMSIMTLIWTIIVEYAMRGEDFWIPGIAGAGFVCWFILSFFRLRSGDSGTVEEALSNTELKERKKQMIGFSLINTVEGFAIFLTASTLYRKHLDDYFISSMALIVGLHFFPLGLLFKRKIDFYMGAFTTIAALTGLYLTHTKLLGHNQTTAVVGICFMATTITYGVRMINAGNKELRNIPQGV